MNETTTLDAPKPKRFNLATRRAAVRRLAIPVEGDMEINLSYRPALITPAVVEALAEAAKAAGANTPAAPAAPKTGSMARTRPLEPDEIAPHVEPTPEGLKDMLDTMIQVVVDSVVEWDVCDGDEPVPITREGLRVFPLDVLGVIVQAIQEDQSPTPTKPAASATS